MKQTDKRNEKKKKRLIIDYNLCTKYNLSSLKLIIYKTKKETIFFYNVAQSTIENTNDIHPNLSNDP